MDFLKKTRKSVGIIYESPHQLKKTLEAIKNKDPNRKLSISREITKKFEETLTGTAQELYDYYSLNLAKGEFVIVLDKGTQKKDQDSSKSIEELLKEYLNNGLTEKEAIKKIAITKNLKKRDVYSQIKIKNKNA